MRGHTSGVSSVAVTVDSKYIVSASGDKSVGIWNFKEKRLEAVLIGHTSYVTCVALTRDSKYIISGSLDLTVRIWNFQEKIQEAALEGYVGIVRCLAITSDNKYIIVGYDDEGSKISTDKYMRTRRALSETVKVNLKDHTFEVICVDATRIALTSDDKYMAILSDFCSYRFDENILDVWNLQKKTRKLSIERRAHLFTSVAITSDNKTIITSNGTSLRIWGIAGWEQKGIINGHSRSVTCLVLSSDKNYIVSGSYDTFIGVWSLQDRAKHVMLKGHYNGIGSLAITSYNKYIVFSSYDMTFRIWKFRKLFAG